MKYNKNNIVSYDEEKFDLDEEGLFNFIKNRDYVSFVEIQRNFSGTEGSHSIEIEDKNIIFWLNLSKKFAELLESMRKKGKIHYEPSSYLVYLADGRTLKIPLAKRDYKYKKPHWLPITIRPGKKNNGDLQQ